MGPRLVGAGATVIVTWADGQGTDTSGCCVYASGGNVATFVTGAGITTPGTNTTQMDTLSILRGIEEAYGFPLLPARGFPYTPSMPLKS